MRVAGEGLARARSQSRISALIAIVCLVAASVLVGGGEPSTRSIAGQGTVSEAIEIALVLTGAGIFAARAWAVGRNARQDAAEGPLLTSGRVLRAWTEDGFGFRPDYLVELIPPGPSEAHDVHLSAVSPPSVTVFRLTRAQFAAVAEGQEIVISYFRRTRAIDHVLV